MSGMNTIKARLQKKVREEYRTNCLQAALDEEITACLAGRKLISR